MYFDLLAKGPLNKNWERLPFVPSLVCFYRVLQPLFATAEHCGRPKRNSSIVVLSESLLPPPVHPRIATSENLAAPAFQQNVEETGVVREEEEAGEVEDINHMEETDRREEVDEMEKVDKAVEIVNAEELQEAEVPEASDQEEMARSAKRKSRKKTAPASRKRRDKASKLTVFLISGSLCHIISLWCHLVELGFANRDFLLVLLWLRIQHSA